MVDHSYRRVSSIHAWANTHNPVAHDRPQHSEGALDQVLGDPIAKVNNEGFIVELDELQIVEGTKLYAPKELP